MIGAYKLLLAAISKTGDVNEYIKLGPIGHLFKNAEADVFEKFHTHVKKHAAVPAMETLKQMVGGIWSQDPVEPPTYYLEFLQERHAKLVLTEASEKSQGLVAAGKSTEAIQSLVTQLTPLTLGHHGNRLVDFRDMYDPVLEHYYRMFKLGDEIGVRLGYPVVDDYGGLMDGDVLSLVGRPAAGKSFITLRGAHRVWSVQKKPPAFFSLEMNNLVSAQRLVAMDSAVPLSNLKLQKGQGLTSFQLEKLVSGKQAAQKSDVPFYLIDANLTATVEDLYNFCRLRKPAVLFVDGAYMLKHPNPRLGRFERVAENCELLKQEIAGNLGIPVVASWQFSREATKKTGGKKKGTPGLEDIGYSDAIGQISSIVLGLLEEESVESLVRKKVTIMKGRNGEVGEFQINWQFNPVMNFDAVKEEKVTEMAFL